MELGDDPDERSYAEQARSLWPTKAGVEASPELLDILDRALARFPDSVDLLILWAHAIQLSAADCPYSLDDARAALLKAATIAPDDPDALSEVGFFYDAIDDDPALAVPYLERAVALAPEYAEACEGLARALAQVGRESDALAVIDRLIGASGSGDDLSEVECLRQEIVDGQWGDR